MDAPRSQGLLESGYRLLWYRIDRVLGRGAFGVTYLAEDLGTQSQVAIKEYFPRQYCAREHDTPRLRPLSPGVVEDFKWGMGRFLNEAFRLARFEQPNIVRILNTFEENGTAYMVMPYERGVNFDDVLERRHTLNEDELAAITRSLLDGLETLHADGTAHCDIKPSNILIRDDGTPVLLDFGSARQAIIERARDWTRQISHGYASIEQYTSKKESQEPAADIYSMGATLYRAVTGEIPPSAVGRREALMGQHDFVPSSKRVAGIYSMNFLAAIDHALAFRAQERPADIAAWREEFGYETNTGDPVAPAEENTTVTDAAEQAQVNANTTRSKDKAGQKVKDPLSVGDITDWLIDASRPGRYRDALIEAHQTRLKAKNKSAASPARRQSFLGWGRGPQVEIVSEEELENRNRHGFVHYMKVGGLAGVLATGLFFLVKPELLQQLIPVGAEAGPTAGYVAGAEAEDREDTAEPDRDNQPEADRQHEQPVSQLESNILIMDSLAVQPEMKAATAGEHETEVYPADAEDVSERERLQKEIDARLEAAREDIKARRLTIPAENNAYEKYSSILEEDPDNQAAIEGLREVVELYVQIALNSMRKGNIGHAEEMLRRAARVDPQSRRLAEAYDELERQQAASNPSPADGANREPLAPAVASGE